MKQLLPLLIAVAAITLLAIACNNPEKTKVGESVSDIGSISGTWQLISGTLVEGGDSVVTDYTRGISMIKVINDTHFAFLNHDLRHGRDSIASFSAGGGLYTLTGNHYTEFLEYCSAREWEGNEFHFTIEMRNDTLIQRGIEKIEGIGVDRLNIEVYHRVK